MPGGGARRRYCRFVEAGISDPPAAPWKNAFGGLLVGSESFAMRVRRLLGNGERDQELPPWEPLRARPCAGADRGGCGGAVWLQGGRVRVGPAKRCDGPAAAAYLARRRYGYSSTEIARVLGYRGPSSVGAAVARVEAAGKAVDAPPAKLQDQLANV